MDYNDFELAMMEEEMSGYDLKSEYTRNVVGKNSAIPIERYHYHDHDHHHNNNNHHHHNHYYY